jgi:hypothetical protein
MTLSEIGDISDKEGSYLWDTSTYLINRGYDKVWFEEYAGRLGFTDREEAIILSMFDNIANGESPYKEL